MSVSNPRQNRAPGIDGDKPPRATAGQERDHVSPSKNAIPDGTRPRYDPSTLRVSKRAQRCLPPTRTCPSLAGSQLQASKSRVPEVESDQTIHEGRALGSMAPSTLCLKSERDVRDRCLWPPKELAKPVSRQQTPVPAYSHCSAKEAMTPVRHQIQGRTASELTRSPATSTETIRVSRNCRNLEARPSLNRLNATPSSGTGNVRGTDASGQRKGASAARPRHREAGHRTAGRKSPTAPATGFPAQEQATKNREKTSCEHATAALGASGSISSRQKAPQLRDAIGLYESLSGQRGSRPAPDPDIQTGTCRRRGESSLSRVNGFEAALRKLSGSWSRTRLARTVSRHPPPTAAGRGEAADGAPGEQHLELGLLGPPLATQEASLGPRLPPCIEPSGLLMGPCSDQPESANLSANQETAGKDQGSVEQDVPLQQQTLHGSTRGEAGASEPVARFPGLADGTRDEADCSARQPSRRRISHSSGTLVARAYCALEQPRPVRASEVKRLVSLCRDKATTSWKGRGQSE
ncbi:hypothetical protein CDD83_6098 [Cordyceps sp. RAO-2017]|nr:hypothetical protein CDD83_6098 [Cordyceps sp. RAO-2017]